jgi:predicted ATPase/class 3 adenylate cyclase
MPQSDVEQIEKAIAALEAQRPLLGDAVIDTAVTPLRQKLATLTHTPPESDELKRVSILFADVSGYTAMSEKLEPEEAAAIMNRLFEELTAAIKHYSGVIDKYSGDAVMALFGAPQAIENHEEMAVRAALEMQTAVTTFSDRLQQERGLTLRLRIGVNTGSVLAGLVGGGSDKSFTVMGDAVNLASRLEHASPVGRVMVSAETARPLHPIFDFDPPQQISVKGKTEPITVYVVIGLKAERGRVRGLAGLHAPMIGREKELAALQSIFAQAITENTWQATAVVGDAGIGKTRLRREFIAWVMQTYPASRLLLARSFAHTQTTPYYVAARLARALFNIDDEMETETAVTRLEAKLQTLAPTADQTERRYQIASLATIWGIPLENTLLHDLGPEQRRDRIFLSLERIFLAAAQTTPLLLIVEDLHWADALSITFLLRLWQTTTRQPPPAGTAMLFFSSRPPETADLPWAELLRQISPLFTLAPLSLEQLSSLADALLRKSVPPELFSHMVAHSQGNPFFFEELMRTFIEDGTLVQGEKNGWRLARPVADVVIPATVQGVLAARLDRLPRDYKRLVQHAAIIGRTFWQRLLAGALSFSEQPVSEQMIETTTQTLLALQERHFVHRQSQSHLADDWEWAFEHVMIQEVAYSAVLKTERLRLHRWVAAWFEGELQQGEAALTSPFLPLVAYHYARAELPDKAIIYLILAGEQAAAQFANEDAVNYFSRALALLAKRKEGARGQQEYRALSGREAVYALTGQRALQAADLSRLQQLANELGDGRWQAEIAQRYAGYYEAISDFPAALQAAQAVAQWAEQMGEPGLKINGEIAWARALWRQGAYAEAHAHLEKTLAFTQQHQDRIGEANCLHQLGTVSYLLGDTEAARAYLEQALAIRRQIHHLHGEADSLNNLIAVYHGLGDFAHAQMYCEQSLAIYQMMGSMRHQALALGNLGTLHHTLGDLKAAQEHHQRALQIYQELRDRGGESLAGNNISLVLCDLGEYEQAHEYSQTAVQIAREVGDREGEGYGLTSLGLALEGLGRLEEAAAAYETALVLRKQIGQIAPAMDDLAGLARLACRQGRPELALAYAAECELWLQAHGIHGIEYPLRVYWTLMEVYTAVGQPDNAQNALATARALLQQQALNISDEKARQSFLENVPLHRQIQSA